ncbi:S8 family peptidase [Acetatifactor muris]|uniref:Subtilase family protein n=1 Tax=Acetatifactor muris TaxID=879566 RepID=A0A2K4ZEZ2_9FIRM|nr:S8 family peptidase [Acetatifactor muris]MCR2047232.1 S8 family peptidase [Acetatifactor muris]SOY29037.1 Subtilase family protein [Acetatifactor muris]
MDCRDKILSERYFDVITNFPLEILEDGIYDLCYINIDNLYYVVYVSENNIRNVSEYVFDYKAVPKLYGLMQEDVINQGYDPNNLIVSGITQVQREPLNLTGRGVVICIIDTGIDYMDEVFRDSEGNSRILAIWDQTIQSGTPPRGFYYGTEFTRDEINGALQAEDPYSVVPSRDENGHGSAMAGVAAGSRVANGISYLGAAPDADIVVVKLKQAKQFLREFYMIPPGVPAYEETDIMLGVQYADSFAEQFRRPVVICLGLGTNYGDHAGSAPLPSYLDYIASKRSRAVVVCGGNEGNAGHHFQGYLEPKRSGGTSENVPVEIRVADNVEGFLLELWGNVPDLFTISVRSPGGETIPPVRLGIQNSITYGFVYERTKITIAGNLVEPASGEEVVVVRVVRPTPGIWTFQVEAVGDSHNGTFHMWLPITQFMNAPVQFLEASPYITLTEPAMAKDVVSVSTYNAANNSFYIDSGRGFTRIGTINPDFAAPGVNVSTIRGRESGSSLASAITAGAVAQFMQWAVVEGNNSIVASREIKNYFIRGASRNYDTTYPNREWGYGRLNVAGTFDALIGV